MTESCRTTQVGVECITGRRGLPGAPFDAEDFAGSGYSTLYLSGSVPQLDTVQFDTAHGCNFIDAESKLRRYRALLESMTSSALDPGASQALINDIAEQL
ncbi:Scr1 family TA system antitoxin-like transcriptional regulator [Streptomyces zingiberis]|uniref:DUF5753 domain-containing protein n=1 Tax=Streptomyces zingiberis TaxID=2053010 RepID=A0ABX1BSC8_9ACTN|nr:Scr1 family TA system antitoxin-like transcriptional regulator [Streptomyces zingiberis]NJQ00645.1 hypothetical protein [Streptomyces zingiberis]